MLSSFMPVQKISWKSDAVENGLKGFGDDEDIGCSCLEVIEEEESVVCEFGGVISSLELT